MPLPKRCAGTGRRDGCDAVSPPASARRDGIASPSSALRNDGSISDHHALDLHNDRRPNLRPESRRPLGHPRTPSAARRRCAARHDQLSAPGLAAARGDQGWAGARLPAAVLRGAVRPARGPSQRLAAGQQRGAPAPARRNRHRAAGGNRPVRGAFGRRAASRISRPRHRPGARNRRRRQARDLGRPRSRPLPGRRAGLARRDRRRDRQGAREEKAGARLRHRLHDRQLSGRGARQRDMGRRHGRRRHRRARRVAPLLQGADGPARHHRPHLSRRHLQERGRALSARRPVARGEAGRPRLCRRAVGQMARRREGGKAEGKARRFHRRHAGRGPGGKRRPGPGIAVRRAGRQAWRTHGIRRARGRNQRRRGRQPAVGL